MAKRRELPPDEALTSSPFASLAGLREQLPAGAAPAPAPEREPAAPARGPARAVVRYERKGRGGKEATIVEQLGLSSDELDVWCRELKRTLGCGGSVEDDRLVLGGDQRKRLPALLEAKGVRRVSVG
jgi:translation initiation factor 1